MTANELAVYLEDITDSEKSPYRQAATMLRQQQAEIETLKKELALQRLSDIGQAIEQEPSMRELTDEEIKKVWLNLKCSRSDALELIFAKAILKKASEK